MKIVRSVGLLLLDNLGRILLLKELESKTHYGKVAGMISIPIKTIEEGETSDQALNRLIIEEVGAPICASPAFFEEFTIMLNGTYTERLRVFTGVCTKSFVAHPNNTDIVCLGWIKPRELLSVSPGLRRVEVEPVLWSFLAH
jgi:hypothetical protein